MANQMQQMDYAPRPQMQQYYGMYNQGYNYPTEYDPNYMNPYNYSYLQYQQQNYYQGYPPMMGQNTMPMPAVSSGANVGQTPRPRPETAKATPVKSEGIINFNMVVPPTTTKTVKEVKESSKPTAKPDLKKPEPLKEVKKEVKKVVKETTKETVPAKSKVPQATQQKPKEIAKAKEDKMKEDIKVREVIKQKEDIPSIVAVKTDLMRFEEITKNLKGGAFSYEIILRIGSELKICHTKPTLLLEGVTNRALEFRDPITGEKKESKMQRRQKTEIEIQIDNEAKAQKKKLEESASKVDTEADLKFALNKLTPDNYSVTYKTIWDLTIKFPDIAVDAIFKKAWSEQNYIPLYGTLCKEIIYNELKKPKDTKLEKGLIKNSKIRGKILEKCHDTFKGRKKLREELKASSKKELTDDELDYFHHRMFFGSTFLFNS